jgi:hypothetical protein
VLTCDVSAGIDLIIASQKQISCAFAPQGPGRREDYDGYIAKYGLDLGLTSGRFMVWSVFTETVAGPGFLAGDYYGASGEVTVAAGLGANVLVGGSNRTVALQPISISGQRGLNLPAMIWDGFAMQWPRYKRPLPTSAIGRPCTNRRKARAKVKAGSKGQVEKDARTYAAAPPMRRND